MRNSIFWDINPLLPLKPASKRLIQKGTAILDVGGGNLQVSLFDKDALVTDPEYPVWEVFVSANV